MILLLYVVIFAFCAAPCADQYPYAETMEWGGSCYVTKPQVEVSTWNQGEEYCVSLGGHLSSVHSDAENKEIFDFADRMYAKYNPSRDNAVGGNGLVECFWLGGRDIIEEGNWFWSDGTPWDHTNWYPSQPDDYKGWGDGEDTSNGEDHTITYFDYGWLDLRNWHPGYECSAMCKIPTEGGTAELEDDHVSDDEYCDVYNDPDCPNYEGGYQAGKKQVGFDDEHFKHKDDDSQIVSIDQILEDMETGFEDEAELWEGQVDKAFNDKEAAYNAVVAAENKYKNKMDDRIAAEGAYNTARKAEELAHDDLLKKITLYNQAVIDYQTKHADYIEKIDFLNYELFIVQQIRELLGEQIGYIPEQVILVAKAYDAKYDGWKTGYPERHHSTFSHEQQRFGQKKKRKRNRRGKNVKKRVAQKKRRRRRRRRR